MGLDMYLTARFKQPYKEPEKYLGYPINHTEVHLAYWRKANQIHHWFVTNVQDGKDDCEVYPITIEQLSKLYRTADNVLSFPEHAAELLPTVQGFFFGSTNYDQSYVDDLKYTRDQLRYFIELVTTEGFNPACLDIFYQSSW